jgi:hypothetical protein
VSRESTSAAVSSGSVGLESGMGRTVARAYRSSRYDPYELA